MSTHRKSLFNNLKENYTMYLKAADNRDFAFFVLEYT